MNQPEWHIELTEKVRPCLCAFTKKSRRLPDLWLYFQDEENWHDWPDLLGIPVANVSSAMSLYYSVAKDEDCPLYPVWHGEALHWKAEAIREFQLRYANTGDY